MASKSGTLFVDKIMPVPKKNSETGEKSRVLRFTAIMSPARVVPQDLLASQTRSANL
jgi:hypothetical protein